MTRPRRGEGHEVDRDWRTVPRPVSVGLEALARRLGAPTASALGAVFSQWDAAVGSSVAAHARPISLTDGVLTVAVDQPGWATQLRYLTPSLLANLAEVAGPDVVGKIEIRVVGSGPETGAAKGHAKHR
jgi:predicted nucleic acid-binding Zn ribbon protein